MDPKRRCGARSFRFDFGTALHSRNVEGLLFVRVMLDDVRLQTMQFCYCFALHCSQKEGKSR
jgi:hypothetical protein